MNCRMCSTCCVAPDISTLGKEAGIPCPHLDAGGRCSIYGERPEVCRGYRPDALCELVAAPTLEERVRNYLAVFRIQKEEEGV